LSFARFRRLFVATFIVAATMLPAAGPTMAADSTQFVWPTSGHITQPFGCTGFYAEPKRGSCDHFHEGLDIANKRGTPVRAVDDGVIELVGWDPWIRPDPDWMVIIDHGNGLRTMYAHLKAKPVEGIKRGAHVTQGQLIGLMDMTGRATGPHLHFGVYRYGEPVNPRDYLSGTPVEAVGSAGPQGCEEMPVSGGVGAWLGGRTAVATEGEPVPYCPG